MKVMIFGTFDLLHEGHQFFIREAKKVGGQLIIVLAHDQTI
jgi:FAD synthetase